VGTKKDKLMFQFPLRALLLCVVAVAIGCAALVHPTDLWGRVVVTVTVVILIASALAAIFGQGSLRVSAGGFAVAGWLHFLLTFSPWLDIREHLLTSQVLEILEKSIHGETGRTPATISFSPDGKRLVTGSYDSTIRLWQLDTHNGDFYNIGHALWTLIFGVFGDTLRQGSL
jgi:hypothetical protein